MLTREGPSGQIIRVLGRLATNRFRDFRACGLTPCRSFLESMERLSRQVNGPRLCAIRGDCISLAMGNKVGMWNLLQ
jgi:hypothetical protein